MAKPPRGAPPAAADRAVLDHHTRERHDRARARHQWRQDVERTLTAAGLVALLLALVLGETVGWSTMRYWPLGPSIIWGFASFCGLVWVVHRARHVNDPSALRLPPYLPPRCTLFDGDYFLGSAYTYDGRGPGDWLLPDDEPLDPHVFINGQGIYSSVIIDGVPGSGKTKGAVYKLLAQAIRMYPKPPAIPRRASGEFMALAPWDSAEFAKLWYYWNGWRDTLHLPHLQHFIDERFGGADRIAASLDAEVNAAYGTCLTEEAALAREAELWHKHRKKRPALVVLNPKQEDAEDTIRDFVRACAAADSPERLAQVKIISPAFGTSIAMFDLRRESADLGDSVRRAIDLIDGRGDDYYAQQSAALLTYCIALLRVVRPGRVNWHEVLRVCSQIEYASELVKEAQSLLEQQLADERDGKPLDRGAVDHNAIAALAKAADRTQEEWDKVTSRVQALGRYILSGQLGSVLAAEVPTFGSWDDVLAEGNIVVIDMPVSKYGEVARASSVLLINAFITAATDYGARMVPADRRASMVFLDEAHLFMSDQLARATALARSAEVAFVFAVQTYAQMDEAGLTIKQTIATNCGNKVSYRESEGHAAMQKAGTHGMHEEMVRDVSVSEAFSGVTEGLGVPGAPRTVNRTASERASVKDTFRFKPEIFMNLPTGRAVVQVTNGRIPQPSRLIQTPQCHEVPWLEDVSRQVVSPYQPPLPITLIDGTVPDAQAADRLWYLYFHEDPTRGSTMGLQVLDDDAGAPRGLLVWTDRFAFAISVAHIARSRPIFERAFNGGVRVVANTKLVAPPLYVASLDEARRVQNMLGLRLVRPLPAAEARAFVALAPSGLPWVRRWAALADATNEGRDQASRQLQAVLKEGVSLDRQLRALERGVLLEAQDRWLDALKDVTGPADLPVDDSSSNTDADGGFSFAPAPSAGTRAPRSTDAPPSLEALVALFGGTLPPALAGAGSTPLPAMIPEDADHARDTATVAAVDRPDITLESGGLGAATPATDGGSEGSVVVDVPSAHPAADSGDRPRPGTRTRVDDSTDFDF